MYFNIDDNKYEILIERKKNKNTYIRVKEDKKIYVYTNKWTKEKDILKLIEENHTSIVRMIKKIEKKNEVVNNNYYLGKEIDIVVLSNQSYPEFYNNKLYIKDKSKLDKYYKDISYPIFKERLDQIYELFEEPIPYPELKIRKMTSRWGVCNRKNISVTLNSELIKKEVKYIDYVIIHELSHFVEFNHSFKFWKCVEKYCRDYKIIRKEMKE
jgi:predicted metal-dependent hydrolase